MKKCHHPDLKSCPHPSRAGCELNKTNCLHLIVKCPYDNITDCPYPNRKKCQYDQRNCYHKAESLWNKFKIPTVLILILLIGIILLFIANCAISSQSFWKDILSGISLSMMAGALIAYLIDIPSRLSDYKEAFVETLISDNYLKDMSSDELTNLRKKITEQLHKKDVPKMAKGLIDLDEQICKLLQNPYYEVYRQTIDCAPQTAEQNYFVKTVSIFYKLINPCVNIRKAHSNLSIANSVFDVPDCLEVIDFSVDVDNQGPKNIAGVITNEITEVDTKTEYYTRKSVMKYNGKDGIMFDYNEKIEVNITYKIKIHIDDITFTKRLKYPVHNFILDYSTQNPDIKLQGQLLGTLIEQKNIRIEHRSPSHINIETLEWLLPQNGIYVVMTHNNSR